VGSAVREDHAGCGYLSLQFGRFVQAKVARNVLIQPRSIIDIIGYIMVMNGIGFLFHRSVLLPGVSASQFATPPFITAQSAATQVTT
jgi:hypothetical protein